MIEKPLFRFVVVAIAAIALSVRASDLQSKIQALPETSPAEQIKKTILRTALEQSPYLPVDESEIRAALAASPESFLTEGSRDNISTLTPVKTVQGNPYLERLVAGARQALAKPDAEWPRAESEGPLFAELNDPEYDPRRTGARMDAFLWLYANPASPMKGDPAVLARFLRRAHTYVAAILTQENKAGKSIYDDFALVPASVALREFAAMYPSMLIPSQKAQWEKAMRVAGDKVMAHSEGQLTHHKNGYANIDAAISLELLNFGLALKDDAMIARSRELMKRVSDDILADGGFHYIWSQNESSGYHDVVCQFIARTYEITKDETFLEMLRRTEWYGPVSTGRQSEYWTAPSWKHTWNSHLKGIAGGEFVAAATENPMVNGMLIRPDSGDLRRWESSRPEVAWFKANLPTAPLPDNVTYPDLNIDGPRAWYGRFSYAATLRDIPTDEPGHATLMGAMTTTEDFGLQVFLMGVFPRVRIGDDAANPRSWAWLTSDLKSSYLVGRNVSVVQAKYDLVTFNSSRVGRRSGWVANQLWLGLSDRIVGQISVSPGTDPIAALDLEGIVRLGTGGTVNGPSQQIQEIGTMTWQYGDLVVQIWSKTFESVEPRAVDFRLPAFPVTELTLSAESDQNPASFLVEIRPSWSEPATSIVATGDAPGFRVQLDGRSFDVFSNPGDAPRTVASGDGTIFVSGDPAPRKADSLDLPPGACAVVVISPRPEDHEPGVRRFTDLVSNVQPKEPSTPTP